MNKKITLTILMIGMFCLVVTAGVQITKDWKTTIELKDCLERSGITNFTTPAFNCTEDGCEEIRIGRITKNIEPYRKNCISYDESNGCLEYENVLKTNAEIQTDVDRFKESAMQHICNEQLRKETVAKQNIITFDGEINTITDK